MLEIRGLGLALPDRAAKPMFGPAPTIEILRDINLDLAPGESLGLVGESGSGKTSLGRTILRLYRPTAGRLCFDGVEIGPLTETEMWPLRARMQMIFQDPSSSLNPRHRIGHILKQPLTVFGKTTDRDAARSRVGELLDMVGLNPAMADRFPHELSGGQRQRVGIARAIATEPELVVADEIVSGLDVSTQAHILALFRDLKRDLGIATIFISHDLSVVRVLCDRVAVMRDGRIVESGACATLFSTPAHPYTRELIKAIPLPEVDDGWLDAPDDDEARAEQPGAERPGAERPGAERQGENDMQIKNAVVFVSGTNRGIGRAFVEGLMARGAAKVYAAARDTSEIADLAAAHDGRLTAIALDITDTNAVAAAADSCGDVALLINNAGVNFNTPLLGIDSLDNARTEMETNYFGTLSMCRAFAPVLKRNGGGTIVNMLSLTALVNLPLMGSLCASKAAARSMTQGVRAELAAQGTFVIGVVPGAVETDMTKDFPPPKMAPADVVTAALDAVEAGVEDIYPGDMAAGVVAGLDKDPKAVEKDFAQYLPQ